MTIFRRPMLAASLMPSGIEHTDENILKAMQSLKYPVLATLKKDGIRAIRLALNGRDTLLSRTLKEIPNASIRERSLKLPRGFDVELWNPSLSYNEIESIVMSREHPDSDLIQFHVLDWFNRDGGYEKRCLSIHQEYYEEIWQTPNADVVFEFPQPIPNHIILHNYFGILEDEGAEGICFRTPDSPYKQGRSTLREQYLIKLARYLRSEGTVIGFIEQQANCNEDKRNALGYMKRSSFQHGQLGKGTLGAFVVQLTTGQELTIGTGEGLTDKLRQTIWDNQSKYIGRRITFKHKPHGAKDLPRSPIFVGFREKGF